MSAFRDLLGDPTADEPLDPYAEARAQLGGGEEAKRKVLATENIEAPGYGVTGFLHNFASDVGHFAGSMGSLIMEPIVRPKATAEALGHAAMHPIDTANQLAAPIIAKYTPQPDESVPGMLARNAYEHPFDTLMDVSTIIQGPFGLAAKTAKMAGAVNTANKLSTIAEYGRAIDPISQAMKAGTWIMKSKFPDQLARIRVGEATADADAAATAREKWQMHEMNTGLQDAERDLQPDGTPGPLALTPAERAIRFAYGEGRIQLNPDAAAITELTHNGLREQVKLADGSAIRGEALDAWVNKYRPLQEEYERMAGLDPATYAQGRADAALRHRSHMPDGTENPGFNPMDPANAQAMDTAYQNGLAEATLQKQRRATVSTRTALDVQKETAFRTTAAKLASEQATFDAAEVNAMLPRAMPTSIDEAYEAMGGKGGLLIPHSMEVLTNEQATVGNVLTKLGESNVYKDNLGARFRAGELTQVDPAAALSRYYQTAIHGRTMPIVAREAIEASIKNGWGYAEKMPKGWNPAHDPDLIKGTHQPVHPASMTLDGMIQEHYDAVSSRLIEAAAGGDEAAAAVNLADLDASMVGAAAKSYPWAKGAADDVYKVTTGFGKGLADYKASFDPISNPILQFADKAMMQPFNMVNLNLPLRRFMNNFYGNTEMITMQGLHPFSARGLMGLAMTGRALAGKIGWATDEISTNLSKVFGLPGVTSGGLSASEAFNRVEDLSQALAAGRAGLGAVTNNPVGRGVGRWASWMSKANQEMESIFRGGSTIFEMLPKDMAAVKNLVHGSAAMADMSEEMSRLRGLGLDAMTDAGLKSATEGMNRWLHNYDRSTPLTRSVGRYVFPYHKFYAHSTELLLRYPFERPIQSQLLRAVGERALTDIKDEMAKMGFDWHTMVPESLRDSIPIKVNLGENGQPAQMILINTKGPNPFGFLASGDPYSQALSALHPLAKIAIERATGTNLFTGDKFQGPLSTFNGRTVDANGAIVEDHQRPPLIEHYLRQFFPFQMAEEIIKNGRSARDTADIFDLLGNAPGAYKLDASGVQIRHPKPFGLMTPVAQFIGVTPSTVTAPSKAATAAEKSQINEQFAALLQQHPERREIIMKKWAEAQGA